MSVAQFVILNEPGEAAVHSQEVGGEGVTYNVTMLFSARTTRDLPTIFEVHRSAQKQYLSERGLQRRIFEKVTEFTEKRQQSFSVTNSNKSDSLVALCN